MASGVIPARLAFLAIYNPSLGRTDETFRDQVVYWYSRTAKERRKDGGAAVKQEENEKLRQIGLAQGMVDFARSFADGQAVDTIDTEKSRFVLYELEAEWWILASIDLTRIPKAVVASTTGTKHAKEKGKEDGKEQEYEYSSREVAPAQLLLRQIIDGHRIFLLHNGSSLAGLYHKLSRQKFCGLLERSWNRFAQHWDVLLHGNPAVEVYGGLKLAAGGELGMGVGEEEWGSGEREVLEEFARRTDGLVDLTVSRFGEPSSRQESAARGDKNEKEVEQPVKPTDLWMGAGNHAQVGDGLIFSGVGAVARSSLRDMSRWTQEIYAYGEAAYGVGLHPSNDRKRRRKPPRENSAARNMSDERTTFERNDSSATIKPPPAPGIPPPIVSAVERSLERATSSYDVREGRAGGRPRKEAEEGNASGWTKYLTLGYGMAWGPSESTKAFQREDSATLSETTDREHVSAMQQVEPDPDYDSEAEFEQRLKTQVRLEDSGHFLIGLKGELSDDSHLESDDDEEEGWNRRTLLRTVHVEVQKTEYVGSDGELSPMGELTSSATPQRRSKLSRLRVVIYVHRPFIYTFLFHPRTESLSLPSFYRNLHTFFAPMHKPLSTSTAPARVAARIAAAAGAGAGAGADDRPTATKEQAQQPIYDLIYDPQNLSVHATIPNIPMPGSLAAEGLSLAPGGSLIPEGWTRAEALNVHSAILEIVRSTRPLPGLVGEGGERELERSVKTGRGWWVVWMRLDDEAHTKLLSNSLDSNASTQSLTPSASPSNDRTPTTHPQSMIGGEKPSIKGSDDYFGPASITHSSDLAPHPYDSAAQQEQDKALALLASSREAILVRRARDSVDSKPKTSATGGGLWSFGLGGSGAEEAKDKGSGWGPARLAEGVGVDARKYVEGLVGLSR